MLNHPAVNRPIPLKERRDKGFIKQTSDRIKINNEELKIIEEENPDLDASQVSNTPSLKMIVPPYQSPPDAQNRKFEPKKQKFPTFLNRNVSNLS